MTGQPEYGATAMRADKPKAPDLAWRAWTAASAEMAREITIVIVIHPRTADYVHGRFG